MIKSYVEARVRRRVLAIFGCNRGTHRDVLRRNSIEKLRTDGNAHVGKVAENLASDTNALVDLERIVDVGIVDETLPPNGCAGLLATNR